MDSIAKRQNVLNMERRRQPSDHKDYKLVENIPDASLSVRSRLVGLC